MATSSTAPGGPPPEQAAAPPPPEQAGPQLPPDRVPPGPRVVFGPVEVEEIVNKPDYVPLPILGICCMRTKASSGPMKSILRRLAHDFTSFIFAEEMILHKPVSEWPVVDCLIAFDSSGFPLEKAVDYVDLRKPLEINTVHQQGILRDRYLVYEKLREFSIPTPNYAYVKNHHNPNLFTETEDYILWDGQKIYKPFVEKPVDGDNHNINVYYPRSSGGGIKRLFRKIENKSMCLLVSISYKLLCVGMELVWRGCTDRE